MADSTRRAEGLFHRAADLPRELRAAFLRRECGDDHRLRTDVEGLLAQLDMPTAGYLKSRPSAYPSNLALAAGQQIDGKYELLEVLGEGGLGVVWLAEQKPPVHRKVALKVIKLGMDSKQVLARFEAERNALVILDHPNIARVLDAGATETGQPYFVMEHVAGAPITEFCDSELLTIRQRLGVFIDVCSAVQHAHQKGIIHRDLKPSNILVTLHEGRPVPKVIDFGVAKATAQDLTDLTLYTLQGQIIGTPEYMSPEQADMSSVGVDSTTDIYSLGVVLYELLTGVLPFDPGTLRAQGFAGLHRVIRETDPPKPSTRMTKLRGQTISVGKTHGADPRSLRSQVKGDLDWIVMKALEKQRTRRYASASELAADIERHLRHEPVVAGPPSASYRVRKFARRNRALVGGMVATFVTLIAGVVVSSWFAVRADRNAALALRRAYSSALTTAEIAVRDHDIPTARSELAGVPEELRGWEWQHLWSRLDDSLVEMTAPQGTSIAVFPVHGESRFGVSVRDADGVLRYRPSFDPWSGGRSEVLEPTASATFSDRLTFGAYRLENVNGSFWLIGGDNNGGGGRHRIDLPPSRFGPVLLADRKVVGIHEVGGAYLLDASTGKRIEIDATERAFRVFANRDRTKLAITFVGGGIQIRSASDGRLLAIDQSHTSWVYESTFLPGGSLATISWDATVRLFDGDTLRPLRVYHGHQNQLTEMAVSADGSTLATRGYGDQCRWLFWDTRRHDPRELHGHSSYVYAVAFHPEGRWLASGGWCGERDGELRVWDMRRRAQIGSAIETTPDVVCSLTFSRDGRLLVTVDKSRTARVYEVNQHGCKLLVARNQYPGNPYGPLTFCADSVRLLWPNGRDLQVWDTNTDAVTAATPTLLRDLNTGHAAPDRSLIAIHDGKEELRCYDPRSERDCSRIRIDGVYRRYEYLRHPIHGVLLLVPRDTDAGAVTPNRSVGRFAAGPRDVAVVDPRTGREVAMLHGHSGEVLSIAVSPAGRRIATCGRDRVIRIWDADTFDELVALGGHQNYVFGLAWSPDGSLLASGSGDHVVRIWGTKRLRDTLLDAK